MGVHHLLPHPTRTLGNDRDLCSLQLSNHVQTERASKSQSECAKDQHLTLLKRYLERRILLKTWCRASKTGREGNIFCLVCFAILHWKISREDFAMPFDDLLRRWLWGYPNPLEKFFVNVKPVIASVRQGIENKKDSKEHTRRARSSEPRRYSVSTLSKRRKQDGNEAGLGSPRIISDHAQDLGLGCRSTDAAQPDSDDQRECRKEPGD